MPYAKKPQSAVPPRADAPIAPGEPIKFEAEPFHYAIPDRVLLADLLKVARRLKAKSLFQQQYSKHGRFVAQTYRQRFGSWNAALEAVGLLPCAPRLVDDADLLRDIQKVAEKLDNQKLTRAVYFRQGRYSATNIARRFGSWSKAVHAAGLIAKPPPPRNPSNKDLFDNFENIWRSVGRQPRGEDVALPHSRYDVGLYRRRFGTFRKALAAFLAHQKSIGKTTGVREPVQIPHRHKTHREVRAILRYQVLSRDNFKCRSCGRSPASDPAVRLHVDHMKPWSAGGETVLENLQTLCETCNAGKASSG